MLVKRRKAASVSTRGKHSTPRKIAEENSDAQPNRARQRSLLMFPYTDVGHAERLVSRHGDKLRYCTGWEQWLVWDGTRWTVDKTFTVERCAIETIRATREQVDSVEDDELGDKLRKHLRGCESRGRLEAMCKLARANKKVVVTPENFDVQQMLFNCGNGTIDLTTGSLQPHNPGDLITKLAPVQFLPSAKCPRFLQFLGEITNGDEELARYLQRCVGYCLSGSVKEKALFFLLGDGDNGKTTFVEIIRWVLGEFAGQIPIESVLRKNNEGIPIDLAQLQGLRFVTSSEIPERRSLDEAKVKYMTGMGKMQGRFLFKNLFEFQPAYKLFLDTNRAPNIAADEKAVWNRIRVIPFTATFSDAQKDKDLPEKLKGEAEGILAWAVQGCLDWQAHGLQEPACVQQASIEYRSEMDTVTRFVSECCEIGPEYSVQTGNLYSAYVGWCRGEGESPVSKVPFGKLLGQRSGLSDKKVAGQRGWIGIKLKPHSMKVAG